MGKIYIVTGAKGHLGSTVIRLLKNKGETVRGLVLPSEEAVSKGRLTYFKGDVRDKASMSVLFENAGDSEVYVIHTAGLIDITDNVSENMYQTNVIGTKNVIELCREYHVKRLVYVSSVHAIPEKGQLQVMKEVYDFSPDKVVGGYAKTKAEATGLVLQAAKEGLDAVVVQPSGIIGPYDDKGNHLVQLVKEYLSGRLPACVHGGYDFVDVRDVAGGCVLAAERGKTGECYILSNRHYEVKDMLKMVRKVGGGRKIPVLPIWVAKMGIPWLEWYAKRKKEKPLYTKYSLHTLKSNDKFSHDKATRELGYQPRDLYKTVKDTVWWLKHHKKSIKRAGRH